MRSYIRMGLAFLACYATGFLSSLFVQTGTGSWYDGLVKPALMPDKWTIPLVWFGIYTLMAVALWLVWERDPHVKEMRGWVPLFFAHLLINACWAIFFFGFHAIFIALIDAIILIFAAMIVMAGAWEIDRHAGWLLVPYFIWTLFIAYLTLHLWLIN